MNNSKLLLTCISLAVLASCSSTKTTPTPSPAPQAAVETPVQPKADLSGKAQTAVAKVVINPFDDPSSPLSKKSVFFEFDKYTITQADGVIVTAHAKYLAGNKAAKVRLEGNADERGGREYNLSLGQKRADAVKQALELTGASVTNIEAVSFGKEKPVDYSHNEDAWAKNRRVDIKYTAK
jgi:peptidoglycan-associated lipoprotein